MIYQILYTSMYIMCIYIYVYVYTYTYCMYIITDDVIRHHPTSKVVCHIRDVSAFFNRMGPSASRAIQPVMLALLLKMDSASNGFQPLCSCGEIDRVFNQQAV